MSVTEEQYELIIKYLDQLLNKDEQILFNSYIENDEEFRQELEQTEVLAAGLKAVEKANEIDQIRSLFAEFDEEAKNQPKKIRNYKSFILSGVAASLLLIVALTYFFTEKPYSGNTITVYKNYFEVFPAETKKRSGLERSGLDRSGLESNDAMQYYIAGDYNTAIPLLIELEKSNENAFIPIYLANCYLQIDEPEKAVSVLKSRSDQFDTELSFTGQFYRWYLGLAYLKSNNKKAAIDVFTRISKVKGVYQKESLQILKEIN